MRLERNRSWGHPTLVRFIKRLGRKVRRRGLGVILVGDLAQPRGGPSPSSHVSHQTGLDVDLWYWTPPKAKRRKLSITERASIYARSVLNQSRTSINRRTWKRRNLKILKLAALSPEVERIMVHPLVKHELCKRTGNAKWLAKVRPWFGHHDHFHVRLKCPKGDSNCKKQRPPSARKSGCDELDYWTSGKAWRNYKQRKKRSRSRRTVRMPSQCTEMLSKE
jgi:penicillin-insensitive murein endopeptidase